MPPKRLLGIVFLVVGLFLLYFGLRATDSIGESIQEGLTGKFSDETTWFLVGGAVAIVVGAALALLPGRTRMA
jgi:uncharacterized membrane protein